MQVKRICDSAVVGTLGGMMSWLLFQWFWNFYETNQLPFLDPYIYQGAIAAVGIGTLLYVREALIYRNIDAFKKNLFSGVVLSFLLGGICFGVAQMFVSAFWPSAYVRMLGWSLLGGALGALSGIYTRSPKQVLYQSLGGILGGVLGGGVFEVFYPHTISYLGNDLGIILYGMVVSVFIALAETFTSTAYIRVLTGENEGDTYLINKCLSIGYSTENDAVLEGYSEVCPKHAHINQNNRQFSIVNEQSGGQVLVNYRLVNQQELKDGDIIKIGSALLQYCEV